MSEDASMIVSLWSEMVVAGGIGTAAVCGILWILLNLACENAVQRKQLQVLFKKAVVEEVCPLLVQNGMVLLWLLVGFHVVELFFK
jgi:hypothetical protein